MDELTSIPLTAFYGRQLDRRYTRVPELEQDIDLGIADSDHKTEDEDDADLATPPDVLSAANDVGTLQFPETSTERTTFDAS
ncbi:hypothetical protein Pcinc_008801 [Petrolisthes cinctipes]|uniref:Uncharacterized protein n=1 Tax=Petrolisthes cinctipes TaxID=88211 RepID=A0AAE1G815_PETCI|nr:hypothetical protein Pcinc_008801 [Petrolisthes cinctipes]